MPIEWRPKNQKQSPKASPSPAPKKPDDYQLQKAEWKRQVEEAERNAPASPWPIPEAGPGLLEDVGYDPVEDRDKYVTVVTERLRRMNE